MATRLTTTQTGNLTDDPVLEQTGSGKPYLKARLAVNSGQGENRVTDYYDLRIWVSDYAPNFPENAYASLHRGDRVTVVGRVESSAWEGKDGTVKSGLTIHVDELAVSIRYATVVVTRNDRDEGAPPAYGARRNRQGGGPVMIQAAPTSPIDDDDPFQNPF